MKIIKGITIFSFVIIIFGSCFNPPEFPIIPEISFDKITFIDVPGAVTVADSLVLSINFKDGDGDLGLDNQNPADAAPPFHSKNYFLADGSGNIQPLTTSSIELTSNSGQTVLSPVINVPPSAAGKLVSVRTRQQSNYTSLPFFPSAYGCAQYEYSYDSIYVLEDDKNIFDNSYRLYRTINSIPQKIFVLKDTFYYEPNPNQYNIKIQFFEKNTDGSYTEFDWRQNYCTTFNGRFPILFKKTGPLEGKLRYAMESAGFTTLFKTKTLKLRIQIFDRALHPSNTIETGDFTLDKIMQGK